MAYNTTVSHVSPMLSYIPSSAWYEGTTIADPDASQYWNSGYHYTKAFLATQASVLFQWFGSDIWIYGGYRTRLGTYKVILDGNSYHFEGFQEGDKEDFNAVLFSGINLGVDYHQIELINTGDELGFYDILDISHLVYQSNQIETTAIPSTNSAYQWGPAWSLDQSIHVTNYPAATMTMNFTGISLLCMYIMGVFKSNLLPGSGIALYGLTGSDHSPFTVFIDGSISQTLHHNSVYPSHSGDVQLIYARNDLLHDNHIIVIRNNPIQSNETVGTTLTIDYAMVYAKINSNLPNPSSGVRKAQKRAGIIGGCVAGGVVLASILAVLLYCRHYKRRKLRIRTSTYVPQPYDLFYKKQQLVMRESRQPSDYGNIDSQDASEHLLTYSLSHTTSLMTSGSPTCVDFPLSPLPYSSSSGNQRQVKRHRSSPADVQRSPQRMLPREPNLPPPALSPLSIATLWAEARPRPHTGNMPI